MWGARAAASTLSFITASPEPAAPLCWSIPSPAEPFRSDRCLRVPKPGFGNTLRALRLQPRPYPADPAPCHRGVQKSSGNAPRRVLLWQCSLLLRGWGESGGALSSPRADVELAAREGSPEPPARCARSPGCHPGPPGPQAVPPSRAPLPAQWPGAALGCCRPLRHPTGGAHFQAAFCDGRARHQSRNIKAAGRSRGWILPLPTTGGKAFLPDQLLGTGAPGAPQPFCSPSWALGARQVAAGPVVTAVAPGREPRAAAEDARHRGI